MPKAKKSGGKNKKDLLNRLNKTFDDALAKAQAEVEEAEAAKAPSPGVEATVDESTSSSASALFAAMAVGPCAALYASPKFGITLADKGVLLVVVALVSIAALTRAYDAHIETARKTEKGKKTSGAQLQNFAIFLVNLCFLLLFLTVGFLILPALGNIVPTEANYALTVGGNAILVLLWQKGVILKGLA